MRIDRFTQKAQEAVLSAQQLAEGEGHGQLEALHLPYALVEQSTRSTCSTPTIRPRSASNHPA